MILLAWYIYKGKSDLKYQLLIFNIKCKVLMSFNLLREKSQLNMILICASFIKNLFFLLITFGY